MDRAFASRARIANDWGQLNDQLTYAIRNVAAIDPSPSLSVSPQFVFDLFHPALYFRSPITYVRRKSFLVEFHRVFHSQVLKINTDSALLRFAVISKA